MVMTMDDIDRWTYKVAERDRERRRLVRQHMNVVPLRPRGLMTVRTLRDLLEDMTAAEARGTGFEPW